MLYGWEGNRRSGVAVAMHHRLSGLPTYSLRSLRKLRKGDEHLAYSFLKSKAPFTFHFSPTIRHRTFLVYSAASLRRHTISQLHYGIIYVKFVVDCQQHTHTRT